MNKTCEEKKLYLTRAEAMAHMLLLPASSQPGLEVYLCRECECFHLGHSRRKKKP